MCAFGNKQRKKDKIIHTKMKKVLTTILFACLVVASYAQNGKITMSVIDSQTKQAVVGAVVSIAPASKPDDAKHFTSGDNGRS